MFRGLTVFAVPKTWAQAFGFWLAHTVLAVVLAGVAGGGKTIPEIDPNC